MGATPTWLYAGFAIGAVGVYLALPQGRRRVARLGAVVALAGLGALLAAVFDALGPDRAARTFFIIFGAIALIGSVRVITHPRPVYCALYFIMVVLAMAGLLIVLEAEFLAAALVIIYAGAIMVTYVFVIMLAQQGGEPDYDIRAYEPLAGALAGFLLVSSLTALGALHSTEGPAGARAVGAVTAAEQASGTTPESGPRKQIMPAGNTATVGLALMRDQLVTLQVAGVLLLIAMVGAIVIARRPLPPEEVEAAALRRRVHPGEMGRRVPPY